MIAEKHPTFSTPLVITDAALLFGNNLLAEYLGAKLTQKSSHPHVFPYGVWVFPTGLGLKHTPTGLAYHDEYALLMPLVEKLQADRRRVDRYGILESTIDAYGWHSVASLYGQEANWKHFYWGDYGLLAEMYRQEEEKAKKRTYGGPFMPENRFLVGSKIEAIWCAAVTVCAHLQNIKLDNLWMLSDSAS